MSEFSDKLEELTKKQRDLENARKKKKSHPEGTEEGISSVSYTHLTLPTNREV